MIKGTEFKNKDFQNLLKSENMNAYEANNDTKAAILKIFDRVFKTEMYRYFTVLNTLRYVDVLQKLVGSFNSTHYRSIRMKPIEVNAENSDIVRGNLFPIDKKPRRKQPVFLIGNYV